MCASFPNSGLIAAMNSGYHFDSLDLILHLTATELFLNDDFLKGNSSLS